MNNRILLHVTMPTGNDPVATRKADAIYYRFINILDGNEQLPNVVEICNHCEQVNEKLSDCIRNECIDLKKEDVIYNPPAIKANSMLNVIEDSERKNIRILLYPGKQNGMDDLRLQETTHNMIIQFKDLQLKFWPAEPHKNPPSFYQPCSSEEMALRYIEALLIDACICNYLGVSDVAYHHDNKQHVSMEKVLFLRELAQRKQLEFLSQKAQVLVKYVASKLNDSTPYISFLSIFTIAPFDAFNLDEFFFFDDYCSLWNEFQRWYFDRHGRLFSKQKSIGNPLETIFARNKYHGQISGTELADKIKKRLETPVCRIPNPPFGDESRFAILIVKHVPEPSTLFDQFEGHFSGKMHQAKWDIKYWGDLKKYEKFRSNLEIVPIMIVE